MEVLQQLGFNPILFVAQIINLLIILFILKKILYKPLLDLLKKREDEIKKGLKDKEDAEVLLLKTQEKETQILKSANEKAKKILSDANDEAIKIRIKAEEQALRESEKILDQARRTIEQEEKEAEERLTRKIGALSLSLLQKSLVGVFGENEQNQILKKATKELERKRLL